jgi:hypothetical protein
VGFSLTGLTSGEWYTYTVNTSNLTVWTSENAGTMTLAQVLANPDDIGIFFGGGVVDGGAGTFAMDNFGTVAPVPVPPSMLLLAPGLLGLVGVRKRFSA